MGTVSDVSDCDVQVDEGEEISDEAEVQSYSFNLLLESLDMEALKSEHCTKGSCLVCKALDATEENKGTSVMLPVAVQTVQTEQELLSGATESSVSLGICRICHCDPLSEPELGTLEAVCHCKGTVALVHMACLEKWLSERDTSTCELCGFHYTVDRVPKHKPLESFCIWASNVADVNQLIQDFMWFCMMTPLAGMACYVLLSVVIEFLDGQVRTENPWMLGTLLANSCLTLGIYYFYVLGCIRTHWKCWYTWSRTADSNITVRKQWHQRVADVVRVLPMEYGTEVTTQASTE